MERDQVHRSSDLTLGVILRVDISSERMMNNIIHPMQVLSFSQGKFVCKNFPFEKDIPTLTAIKTEIDVLDKNRMNSEGTKVFMQHSNRGVHDSANSHALENIPKLVKMEPSHSRPCDVLTKGVADISNVISNVNCQQKSSILKGLLIHHDITKAKMKKKKCQWSSPRTSEEPGDHQRPEVGSDATSHCNGVGLRLVRQSLLKLHNVHNKNQCPSLVDCTDCGAPSKDGSHFFDRSNLGLRKFKMRRFPCTKCGRVLRSEYMLKRHLKKHQNTLDVYCIECDAAFSGQAALRAHYATTLRHKDSTGFKFPCDKCSKRCQTAEELLKHGENFHERTVHFSCEQCGQGYASRQGLYTHTRKEHQGYRPPRSHMCHSCAKSFTGNAVEMLAQQLGSTRGVFHFDLTRQRGQLRELQSELKIG